MAYTVVNTKSVFGNQAVSILDITADAATQAVQTGLKNILGISVYAQSCSSAGFKVAINSNASGVQAFGTLGMSGLASGDRVFVTVYGTR